MKATIFGIKLNHRMTSAGEFQHILSKYGCNIKTRIGLHNVEDGVCSPNGVILLEVIGEDSEVKALETELQNFDSAEIQKMVFVD